MFTIIPRPLPEATELVDGYASKENVAYWNAKQPAGTYIKADGSVEFTEDQSMNGNTLKNLAAPTDTNDPATKGYVDERFLGNPSIPPVADPCLADDSLSTPPGSPIPYSVIYIVGPAATGAWTGLEGHAIQHIVVDGAPIAWVSLFDRPIQAGDRFLVTAKDGAGHEGGSFIGKHNKIVQVTGGVPGAYTYDFSDPVNIYSVLVNRSHGDHFGQTYTYEAALDMWVQTGTGAEIPTGDALEYRSGALNVQYDGVSIKLNVDNELHVDSTDSIPEGSTNKYFTDERAQDALAGAFSDSNSIDVSYDDAGNAITADLKISDNAADSGKFLILNDIQSAGTLGLRSQIPIATTATAGILSATTQSISGLKTFLDSLSAPQFTSTIVTGTAPFVIASTTQVANLNADLLDGAHVGTSDAAIPLLNGTNTWAGTQAFSTQFTSSVITGTSPFTVVSTTLVTNLNADLLDGAHVGTSGAAVPLLNGNNTHSGTLLVSNISTTGFRVILSVSPTLHILTVNTTNMKLGFGKAPATGPTGNFIEIDGMQNVSRIMNISGISDSTSSIALALSFTQSGSKTTSSSLTGEYFNAQGQQNFSGTASTFNALSGDYQTVVSGTRNSTVAFTETIYGARYGTYSGSMFQSTSANAAAVSIGVQCNSGWTGGINIGAKTLTITAIGADVGGYVLTYDNYVSGIANSTYYGVRVLPTVLSSNSTIGTFAGNGIYVDMTYEAQSSATGSTLYGLRIKTLTGAETHWGYYNGTAVNNLMGLDNSKTFFGTGQDAAHWYDGTNWNFNPREVGTGRMVITAGGLTLPAGTATAGTAPLMFATGTSLTAAVAGAMEYTTDDLFFTISTGAARKRLLFADPVSGLTSGRVPFATTNGRLTDSSTFTYDASIGLKAKMIYGCMHATDISQSVTIVTPDVFVQLGTGLTGGSCNQFTFQNSRELRALVAGEYLVTWAMSLNCATNNQNIEGCVMVNGTPLPETESHQFLGTGSADIQIGSTQVITLAVDDVVSLAVNNVTAANPIIVEHVGLSLLRVDD